MSEANPSPMPPPYLDEAAQAKWTELLPILQARGEVDQGELDALAAYCSAWSQWLEGERKVKELGLVVKSPVGFAQENPYAAIARKAQTEFRRWGNELGLTPAARKKVRTLQRKPTADPEETENGLPLLLLERQLRRRMKGKSNKLAERN
jgi:P27 family predicted phage terminase small subunit